MGSLFSKCWGKRKNDCDYKRLDDVYPFPYLDDISPSLQKNDEKFFFIRNEEKIDRIINYLDEVPNISERDINLLEQTLAELRILKQNYTPSSPYSLLSHLFRANERGYLEKKSESQKSLSENDSRQDEESLQINPSWKSLRNHQGSLLVEIQKASFLHAQFVEKYKLKNPYVTVNIYPGTKENIMPTISSVTNASVKTFETLSESSAMRPEWHQFFEYNFGENEDIPKYSIGISLFYASEIDNEFFQIGKEQIYAFSSLLDQKVESKQIDFKDPVSKGVLAKVRVRIQLLHNVEKIRVKNLRDIRTRIEKLMRIKKKYVTLFPERNEYESTIHSTKLALSETESIASLSSAHENDEITYFVS